MRSPWPFSWVSVRGIPSNRKISPIMLYSKPHMIDDKMLLSAHVRSPSFTLQFSCVAHLKSFLFPRIPLRLPLMANSIYEYTRNFESSDVCLPHCWIVVRVDGQSFHKFSEKHKFEKPNDSRALGLACRAAERVMLQHSPIVLAYGQSDEFSFVFQRLTDTFNRRSSKLSSTVVSLYSSSYVFEWPNFFPDVPLLYPPAFDARVILYPTTRILRDYLSWRQVDCHINNLFNTCFWKLVNDGGLSTMQAEERLRGTVASDKNELLFSQFNCNYNNEPELFRKGTILFRHKDSKRTINQANVDIIKDTFWEEHPEILGLD